MAFADLPSFIQQFEDGTLPKPQWTHHAHLAVALWYLTHHSEEEALDTVRQRIRAYNEASGTPNTDTGGYHETLTRFFLNGVSAHIAAHKDSPLAESLASLLCPPMADKDWPLQSYSRERLFSAHARHQWVEPDFTTSQ